MLTSSTLRLDEPEALPLWHHLGVPENATRFQVDSQATKLRSAGLLGPQQRLAWKVLRDPFYRDAYSACGDMEAVTRAGFWDDGFDQSWDSAVWGDTAWLCTPLQKIRERLQNWHGSDKPIVLLTTGGFSPLHLGHIGMMQTARAALEAAGRYVAGGYFSLSHDGYVSTKYGGSAALSVHHRVSVCHEALADNDWLMVDPWEAREVPGPINFTDVYSRLQAYLARHLVGQEVELVYVFGSDNADFLRAFVERGSAICVGRGLIKPASQRLINSLTGDAPARLRFVGPTATEQYSSTAVRAGAIEQLHEAARVAYSQWRNPRSTELVQDKPYLIRDDLDWAAAAWGLPPEAHSWFTSRLKSILEEAFATACHPDEPFKVEVSILRRTDQQGYVDALTKEGKCVLNLDAGTTSQHGLRLSRRFKLADGQVYSRTLKESPGSPSLEHQLQALPPGGFVLVDDDTCSGQTLNAVLKLLPKNVSIEDYCFLAQKSFHEQFGVDKPYAIHDIVDARDFLLGARSGGLVVTLPYGAAARVPYMAPYVNLMTRAKLPPSTLAHTNRKLWELNRDFFEKWGGRLTVGDSDGPVSTLLSYLGFNAQDRLKSVCEWHLARLG